MGKPQYGYRHKKTRAKAMDAMVNGAPCPRCNRPMYKWQRLQLGHVVSVAMGGSDGPTRIEHGSCNERAGVRLGNRLKAIRRNRYRANRGMPSLGDRTSGIASNSSSANQRLPKW
jgi:hypothetical protein